MNPQPQQEHRLSKAIQEMRELIFELSPDNTRERTHHAKLCNTLEEIEAACKLLREERSRPAPSEPDCFNDINGDGTCEHSMENDNGETKPICSITGNCCYQEIFDRRPVYYQVHCNVSQHNATTRNQTIIETWNALIEGKAITNEKIITGRNIIESLRRSPEAQQ